MHNIVRKGVGRITRFTLALALAFAMFSGAAGEATAQEILLEGPLAGAPAVRKQIEYRRHRFSVGPQLGYTLLNDYMHNFMIGAKAEYNFTDWLGFGVVGFYAFNAPTKLTKHISESRNLAGDATVPGESNWPSYTGAAHFEDQVALLKSMILGQLAFVPLRGKLAAFEKLFVGIDGYLFVGGGVVMFKQRSSCDIAQGSCGNLDTFRQGGGTVTRELVTRGTFTAGIGFTAYFNDFIGLNFEYRVTPFKWNAGGTDESGQAGSQWVLSQDNAGSLTWDTTSGGSGDYPDGKIDDKDEQWNSNQSVLIGVVFNLPTKPRITN
ncbi:MAG: outer membrane beta-barrel domain-containing protein [Deltaproteobacteria bacterium]|nr:outer membrane beta-barrel domain-containing protein [Deltaproteobacteria bacterium]